MSIKELNIGAEVCIISPQYTFDTEGDIAIVSGITEDAILLERNVAFNKNEMWSYPFHALKLVEEEDTIVTEPKASKNDKKDCKPDYSLIPKILLDQLAYVMMAGEVKYGRYNYTAGHKSSQLTAAAARHIKCIENDEDIDRDTTERLQEKYGDKAPEICHWACIAACSLMALHQIELGTHIDDRFKKRKS